MSDAKHLYRHACHALEDFESVRHLLEESPAWTHELEKKIHAISHHLRHTVYRSSLQIRKHKRVRRSGETK